MCSLGVKPRLVSVPSQQWGITFSGSLQGFPHTLQFSWFLGPKDSGVSIGVLATCVAVKPGPNHQCKTVKGKQYKTGNSLSCGLLSQVLTPSNNLLAFVCFSQSSGRGVCMCFGLELIVVNGRMDCQGIIPPNWYAFIFLSMLVCIVFDGTLRESSLCNNCSFPTLAVNTEFFLWIQSITYYFFSVLPSWHTILMR